MRRTQAGGASSIMAGASWWCTIPREEWPGDDELMSSILEDWQEPWGDRRQELVFIGVNIDETWIRQSLDNALVADEEFAAGESLWCQWSDPYEGLQIAPEELKPKAPLHKTHGQQLVHS